MDKYLPVLETIDVHLGDLQGLTVLEIGSATEGTLTAAIAERAKRVIGINLVGKTKYIAENADFLVQDARNMDFRDGLFDLIVSYATFEHVSDFSKALAEMSRVLAPNGRLFSLFGPIWSCPWGHHLWYAKEGNVYTYREPLIPPYAHLAMEVDELSAILNKKLKNSELSHNIASYAISSPEQNKLTYSDYERSFNASDLNIDLFKGTANRKLMAMYEPLIDPVLEQRARDRYADNTDFRSASITVLATKAAHV